MSQKCFFSALTFLFCMFIVVSAAWAGTTGKIRGKVTDRETGEALVGANVSVEGTTLGAAADLDGTYIILNVPPGTYVLRASFIGYQTFTISNIKVNVDLTTEIDFQLPSEAITVPTVEIVAQAPLVSKSATNTVSILKGEQIEQLPLRGVTSVFALSGGVVRQGGAFYVRGGRSDEVAYYVDGVLVNNIINQQLTLNVINNAIEEVSSQIGGMTAEYGGSLSGVVNTTTRTGGSKYSLSFEGITDELGGKESRGVFDSYSYGQNEYVLTAGGPLVPASKKIRFFVAGQRVLNRSGISALDGVRFPIRFDSTKIEGADFIVVNRDSGIVKTQPAGTTGGRSYIANLLNSVDVKGGRNVGGLAQDSWALNGNVYFDLSSFNIKVGGTYNQSTSLGALGRGFGIFNFVNNSHRAARTEDRTASAYAKFTHVVDPSTFYTLNLGYHDFFQESGDNVLWDDYEAYGDPAHPANGHLIGPSRQASSPTIYGFQIPWPGALGSGTYGKLSRRSIQGRLDFVHQFGSTWELKLGGEIQRYTIRTYSMPGFSIARARFNSPTASDWQIYNDVNVTFYGYDIYGNEFDGGSFTDKTGYTVTLDKDVDGPRHPVIAGAYVQNKIELEDMNINAGLRLDYINPGSKQYANLANIELESFAGVTVVSANSLAEQDPTVKVSPRLGFSFPVTDRTVFHAQFGKFVQQGQLADLYDTRTAAGRFLEGGFARQFPNPNLRPEKTTAYEIGFRQQLGEVASFDMTFFYKDIKDLHVIRVIFSEPGAAHRSYFTNVNGDFGTVKGLTFVFNLRRTRRISAMTNYTLQAGTSTGSTSRTHFDIAWQDASFQGRPYFPVIPSPTEFDRTHTGVVNLDYRFEKNDGPTLFGAKFLERVGVNALFTFASGRRYTKQQVDGAFSFSSINAPTPFETLNASTGPFTVNLDVKVDKSFALGRSLDVNVYLWIANVLNRRNVEGFYQATGEPDNDGWLATEAGQTWIQNNGPEAKALYEYLVDNIGFYGAPRHVRLGVKLNL